MVVKAAMRKMLAVVAVAALGLFLCWIRHHVRIDRCLDRGGAWNYDEGACEESR